MIFPVGRGHLPPFSYAPATRKIINYVKGTNEDILFMILT